MDIARAHSLTHSLTHTARDGGGEEEDRFQCARTYLAAALYFARKGEISLL